MFQQVYKSVDKIPSRVEFIGNPWTTLLAAISMASTPAKDDVVEIYDVHHVQKAATIYPSGRVSIRSEYRND